MVHQGITYVHLMNGTELSIYPRFKAVQFALAEKNYYCGQEEERDTVIVTGATTAMCLLLVQE